MSADETYRDRLYQEHRDSRGEEEWTDNLKIARSQASLLDPPDFCKGCDEEQSFCVCWSRR